MEKVDEGETEATGGEFESSYPIQPHIACCDAVDLLEELLLDETLGSLVQL